MGKSEEGEVEVTRYHMSIHFGVCMGPVDYVAGIYVGDKTAWTGYAGAQMDFNIDQRELFGGDRKEGGVQGNIAILPGHADQLMSSRLAAKFGLTPDTMPAYRGMTTVFFSAPDPLPDKWDDQQGFLWAANNPYLKTVWIKVARASPGLDPTYARIWRYSDTISRSQTVEIDAQDNAGTTVAAGLANGVQISADPSQLLRFTMPVNEAYDYVAWSPWGNPSPAVPGASGSSNTFRVAKNSDAGQVSSFGSGVHDGYEAARAAFSGGEISGASTYTFFFVDSPFTDNTGGLSINVDFYDAEFDSNPAHMIYECLVNESWGAGFPASSIDIDSFEQAAVVLYSENFGLSMLWTQQTTVENFIKEIIDHIEGAIFTHPRTGLLTLKLIRGDYDPDTLPIFNPNNSVVRNFKRKLIGELITELVVTWTNPANEEEETVTVQNDALIALQGLVSDSRNYYGIRSATLATAVGYRDLRSASYPAASCDLEADRSAWDKVPGDVIKVTSPEDGVIEMVMRVGPIDYGGPGSMTIKASLIEDIFGLEVAEFTTAPASEWIDPAEEPTPADYTYLFTLPYYMALQEAVPVAAYPTVYAGILAAEDGLDTYEFELWGEATISGGGVVEQALGNRSIASRAELVFALPAEVISTINGFPGATRGIGPEVGGIMILGEGEETEVELALITANAAGVYTVQRGAMDTVPRAWPIGTPVWFVGAATSYVDYVARSAAEIVEYKVLPRTSLGLLPVADAPDEIVTLTARPHLPLRPANVKVHGVGFSTDAIDAVGVNPIAITWSERNRLTEDTVLLPWTAATVTPETGQTNRVIVMDLARNILTTNSGLIGTSYNLSPADFDGNSIGIVRVESERDGLISLQGHELVVEVDSGYGYGYGYNYGGA